MLVKISQRISFGISMIVVPGVHAGMGAVVSADGVPSFALGQAVDMPVVACCTAICGCAGSTAEPERRICKASSAPFAIVVAAVA